MTLERRYLWIAVGIVVAVVVLMLVAPKVRDEFAPEPVSALVAVQVEGSDLAEVGRIEVTAGQRFTLHAVVVAEDRKGDPFYYTEAARLRVDGTDVDPSQLRPWNRSGEIAVLWFTLEGYRPFTEVASLEELERFRFEVAFRPDWGRGWTAAGTIEPRNHSLARSFEGSPPIEFGTARYHVRIEKYFRAGDPAPLARFRSAGWSEEGWDDGDPTMVVAKLGDGLERVSTVFGLPQLEPAEEASGQLLAPLVDLYRQELGFTRLLVLSGFLQDRQLTLPGLDWQSVDLEQAVEWGSLGRGDLLRSGERVVVLYEDRGELGRLDYEDSCFDFFESAAIRRLGDVFAGGGVLDWADLDAARQGGEER